VLCAIGFSVRSALGTLADLGLPVNMMRVSGGQSKNERWNQLKADIIGVSLMVPEISDGELAGNAVLAALALNGIPIREKGALDDVIKRMIRFREIYEPLSGAAAFWEHRYELFRSSTTHEIE
jgi:xylulokinase